MGYKKRIQDEIRKEELKDLWQKIYEAYQEGGAEQIELVLNSLVADFKENYKQTLRKLQEML